MDDRPLPAGVVAALERAAAAEFPLSSEHGVGRFLAALAAGIPPNGRILEMGTGAGVGTAWIVAGLAGRSDVQVTSIEQDAATHAVAQAGIWPAYVRLLQGDVLARLGDLGSFDLIFADAQGGKWEGLDRTIAALAPRGVLLVDDMTPLDWWTETHAANQARVRRTILGHRDLISAELAEASGMIVAVRRVPGDASPP